MSFFLSHACAKGKKGEVGNRVGWGISGRYLQGLKLCRGASLKKGHMYKSLYISEGVRDCGKGQV